MKLKKTEMENVMMDLKNMMYKRKIKRLKNQVDGGRMIIDQLNRELSDNEAGIEHLKIVLEEQHQEILNLKKALLFYLDVATSQCSSRYDKDMDYWCKKLLDCNHKAAKKLYGNYKYESEWELG